MTKVLVALSGGVDSSAAALLLQKEGYELIGVTLKMGEFTSASAPQFSHVKSFCRKIGIPHYLYDISEDFKEKIIDNFKSEYQQGRTPNPCVLCNRFFKFGYLNDIAKKLGAKYLATGHYSRISEFEDGNFYFFKGKAGEKEQSYFLWNVQPSLLKKLIFPLYDKKKEEIRELLRNEGISFFQKKDSQEVCFIKGDYREWLKEKGIKFEKGKIVDSSGKVLGQHNGIINYTIGQRKGLGISAPYPLYVIKINALNNLVVVGPKEEVYSSALVVKDVNLFSPSLKEKKEFLAAVKVRYRHKEAPARIIKLDSPDQKKIYRVEFEEPQWAITPGQSAVFYDGKRLIGGGIIDENS